MSEIALSGLKKDEERDLILQLLMIVIRNYGNSLHLTDLNDSDLNFHSVTYTLNADNSLTLQLVKD
jgi:hypothetical protein